MGRGSRRDRGAALIIALLVMTILAFLGGVLLLMSQGETRIASNMRQSTAAFAAAEAGLETVFNQLPQLTPVSCTKLAPGCNGLTFYSGRRAQGSAQPVSALGPQPAAAGYNLETTQWNGYLVFSTGMSTTFLLFVTLSAEVETTTVIGQICRGTDYTCS